MNHDFRAWFAKTQFLGKSVPSLVLEILTVIINSDISSFHSLNWLTDQRF